MPTTQIIVAGPVIIENNKVLLVRSKKDTALSKWKFPGGKAEETDTDTEATCRREAAEELGIQINIKELIKKISIKDKDTKIILIHYLAERIGEIQSGHEINSWDWHDINNLPSDCEQNIYEVISEYKNRETELKEPRLLKS